MKISPMRTEEDYEAALSRIEEIFDSEPGSPEDDELEILVTLVDAYEENYLPIGMPHTFRRSFLRLMADFGEAPHKRDALAEITQVRS